jgi:hypothetical protein
MPHDIYKDTCLHPLVIADGVARCDLRPKDPAELAGLLELRTVVNYRYNAEFRQKLEATRNGVKAYDGKAEIARAWLKDKMLQWGREILGKAPSPEPEGELPAQGCRTCGKPTDYVYCCCECTPNCAHGKRPGECNICDIEGDQAYDAWKERHQLMNNIEIIRISSVDLPHHPAYVARDLRQVQKVCKLIGTEDTVWSQEQIDTIGRRAAKGEFNMHTVGNRTTISFK